MKIRFEDSPAAAEQSRGLHVDYVAAKRNIPAWRWNLIVLLLVSPALYLLGGALLNQIWITAPGAVELRETRLHTGQGGQIGFIVPESSRVEPGSTLAVLNPSNPGKTPPAEPPKAVPAARNDPGAGLLAYRRERVRRYRELWQQGAATQAELAGALAQLAEAESAYGRRRTEIPREPARTPPEKTAGVSIVAPHAGVVAQVSGKIGDWVAAGADLLTLVDDREAKIVAYLDPRHLRYADPGRSASIKFPDGTRLRGKVSEVKAATARVSAGQAVALKNGSDALQLVLLPQEELPERYRKQGLPVEVYFDMDFAWLGFGRK